MPQTIKSLLETNYAECFDTLKEVAKDDHDGRNILYPVEEERLSFINFDSKLAGRFYQGETTCCVDTIDIQEKNINLIEFKNGKIDDSKKKRELKLKGTESLLTLYKLLKKENFLNSFKEIFDYSINYYVVLNKDVGENLNYIDGGNGSNRTRLSNNSRLSGLYPNYEGTYFKKVRILSFEQFQERYLEKYFMEILNCN